jgi:hypothetical protein
VAVEQLLSVAFSFAGVHKLRTSRAGQYEKASYERAGINDLDLESQNEWDPMFQCVYVGIPSAVSHKK